jgi:hypothetical protein
LTETLGRILVTFIRLVGHHDVRQKCDELFDIELPRGHTLIRRRQRAKGDEGRVERPKGLLPKVSEKTRRARHMVSGLPEEIAVCVEMIFDDLVHSGRKQVCVEPRPRRKLMA